MELRSLKRAGAAMLLLIGLAACAHDPGPPQLGLEPTGAHSYASPAANGTDDRYAKPAPPAPWVDGSVAQNDCAPNNQRAKDGKYIGCAQAQSYTDLPPNMPQTLMLGTPMGPQFVTPAKAIEMWGSDSVQQLVDYDHQVCMDVTGGDDDFQKIWKIVRIPLEIGQTAFAWTHFGWAYGAMVGVGNIIGEGNNQEWEHDRKHWLATMSIWCNGYLQWEKTVGPALIDASPRPLSAVNLGDAQFAFVEPRQVRAD